MAQNLRSCRWVTETGYIFDEAYEIKQWLYLKDKKKTFFTKKCNNFSIFHVLFKLPPRTQNDFHVIKFVTNRISFT